ncbi:MAG: SDR family oxidoreductase [Actinomycetota bacterium]|nr:SDR family oxidoreductase [Actinomycetota bacterium]
MGSHRLPEEGIVVPLHRLGTPAEVARAVVYVVESDFMTGGVVSVDGGITSGY